MLEMPVLETPRLIIRPFALSDLEAVYLLFDIELNAAALHTEKMGSRDERAEWLQWTVLTYRQLAMLNQPPYGDRAIILRSTNTLIGSCGYVPCLNAFEQMPDIDYHDGSRDPGRYSPEFGLFYAISPSYRRQGYASEAALALVDYAFGQLHLKRVIATTDYDNPGSIAVMRRLGMTIGRNPLVEPSWLQIAGTIENGV
jgi:[ribosomal protein S5]-alanine N-acetyltransferase